MLMKCELFFSILDARGDLHTTSSNLAIIDGGDLVEDPVAGLSSLLDLKFIDKLDRTKEQMIEYLLLFIAQ